MKCQERSSKWADRGAAVSSRSRLAQRRRRGCARFLRARAGGLSYAYGVLRFKVLIPYSPPTPITMPYHGTHAGLFVGPPLSPLPPPTPRTGAPAAAEGHSRSLSPDLSSFVLRLVSPLFCSVGLYAQTLPLVVPTLPSP